MPKGKKKTLRLFIMLHFKNSKFSENERFKDISYHDLKFH